MDGKERLHEVSMVCHVKELNRPWYFGTTQFSHRNETWWRNMRTDMNRLLFISCQGLPCFVPLLSVRAEARNDLPSWCAHPLTVPSSQPNMLIFPGEMTHYAGMLAASRQLPLVQESWTQRYDISDAHSAPGQSWSCKICRTRTYSYWPRELWFSIRFSLVRDRPLPLPRRWWRLQRKPLISICNESLRSALKQTAQAGLPDPSSPMYGNVTWS